MDGKKISLFFLIIWFSCNLFAQQDQQEKQLQEVVELDQLGLINNTEIIGAEQKDQSVSEPYLFHSLFPSSLPDAGNFASVIQHGNVNQASLTQTGNRNSFGLLQDGNRNRYEGLLVGEENLIRVFQIGNNNFLQQDLAGSNMNLEVIQEGNNHKFTQIERDGTSPAYQVRMEGNNGMEIILKHEVEP